MRLPLPEEVVDVVDRLDTFLRAETLEACLKEGLLHRAVAVLVFQVAGGLIMQQRSFRDRWHPGRWTLSCTGHVKAGESYEAAARRELKEELGLSARITGLFKLNLPRIRSRGLCEYEIVKVFRSQTDEAPLVDRSELEKVESVMPARLEEMMRGRGLTPDAKILIKECVRLAGNDGSARNPFQRLYGTAE